MEELFSLQQMQDLWGVVYQWLLSTIFVIGNAVQLLVVAATLGIARLISRRLVPRLERFQTHPTAGRAVGILLPLTQPMIWLLVLWLSIAAATRLGWPYLVLNSAASLVTAWVAIRLVSQLVKNPVWAKFIAWTAWSIAGLQIIGWLQPMIAILDSIGIKIGNSTISLYTVAKSTLALAVLLSFAVYLTGVIEARIRTSRALSPSVQVLFAKSLKIVLVSLAILTAADTLGIDLTALAVFGGAIGLGVGFGLQKVISNLISGVILLVDKSIKPGDVIAVAGTYGWVTALGGRYVSVVTRDGIEHLIPNETLISERVENWTHSNNQTRIKADVGVHYKTDVKKAMELCVEAAQETERVLSNPEARCLLLEFGDSSVNLQLRFWISDAHNGVQNVKSAVMLRIWEKFHENDIEIPYPQRDLHLRSGMEFAAPARAAAPDRSVA